MKIIFFSLFIFLLISGCKEESIHPSQVNITILASSVPAGRIVMMDGTYSNNSGIFNFISGGSPENPYEKSFLVPNYSTITVSAVAEASSQEAHLEILVNGKPAASKTATPGPNGLVMAQLTYVVRVN